MKRPICSALLVALAALILGGCMSWSRRPGPVAAYRGPRTVALAITVDGVLQPTPQQYAAIQAQAVKEFGALGYTIVTDLTLAESIARINFVPNPVDPENSGRAVLLGFRANPYYASANTSPSVIPGYGRYPTAFGYAGSYSNANWYALNNFGYGYYGYDNSYYDGYTYSTTTLNPVKPVPPVTTTTPTPPYRHGSERCPPDFHRTHPVIDRTSPDYVAVARRDSPTFSPNPGHWHRGPGDSGGSSGGSSSTTRVSSSSSGSTYGANARRNETSGSSGDTSSSRGTWQADRTWGTHASTSSSDRGSWRDRASSSGSSSDHGSWRSSSSSYSRSDSGSSSSYSGGSSSYSAPSSSSYSSSSSSSYSAPSSSSSYSGGSSGGSSSSPTESTVATRSQN